MSDVRTRVAVGGSVDAKPITRLAGAAVTACMIAAIMLERVATPTGTATPISLTIPILVLVPALLALTGMFTIHVPNLILYGVMIGVCAMTQIAGGRSISIASFMLLVTIHSAYIWRAGGPSFFAIAPLRAFRNLALFLAFCAFAQVALPRITGSADLAFPLETYARQWLMPGYNSVIAVDESLTKPNGIFLDEPSILSQVLAAALVVELILNRTGLRALILITALFSTLSGTGLLMLAAALPLLVFRHRRFGLLLLPILVLPIALLFVGEGAIRFLFERQTEFSNTQSSGYSRFLGIFDILNAYVFTDLRTMLFGRGAGSIVSFVESGPTLSHDPTWGKIVFEYGIVGGATYIAIMLVFIFGSRAPLALQLTLAVQFFFTGGYALTAPAHAMILPLLVWATAHVKDVLPSTRPRDLVSDDARHALRENERLAQGTLAGSPS